MSDLRIKLYRIPKKSNFFKNKKFYSSNISYSLIEIKTKDYNIIILVDVSENNVCQTESERPLYLPTFFKEFFWEGNLELKDSKEIKEDPLGDYSKIISTTTSSKLCYLIIDKKKDWYCTIRSFVKDNIHLFL